jgi:chromosome segregation ATPase
MFAFDTLAFAKKLRGAGYTELQAEALAEAQVEVFRQMLESTLATKEDIKDLKSEIGHVRDEIAQVKTELHGEIAQLRGEIGQVKTELHGEIAQLRGEIGQVKTELHGEIVLVKTGLQGEIAQAVRDMKIWFGSMLVVAVTVLATLNKVL